LGDQKIFDLGKQQRIAWDTTSKSTKRPDIQTSGDMIPCDPPGYACECSTQEIITRVMVFIQAII